MAALDFPSSPINGQTYTGPNGAVYTWDGAAWTVSGVLSTGSAAGGSLAGTYPNPSVAASAIRGTPSSGGTAREIQKASIWGGDDLINLSVPTTKLALKAAVVSASTQSLPGVVTMTTAEQTLFTLSSIAIRGGVVSIQVALSGLVSPANTSFAQGNLRAYLDTTTLLASQAFYVIAVSGIVGAFLPMNYAFHAWWNATAGTHTFDLRAIASDANASWQVRSGAWAVTEYA